MRFLVGWSRWFDVLVACVMSVSCSFVLKVLFVIACNHILMSSRLWFCYLTCVFSQELIDNMHFLIFINLHVCNWRYWLFSIPSACSFSPVSLYSFNVPLIDYSNNFFSLSIVEVSKNALISMIYYDFFLFRRDSVK
jgi:hypothetical protein